MIDKATLESVLAAELDAVETDEEEDDRWSSLLLSVSLETADEVSKEDLLKLFNVSKAALKTKRVQLIAAFDELEKVADADNNGGTAMQAEIDRLQEELLKYKRQSAPGDNYLRSEISQLEEKNVKLTRELGEAERRFREEERANDQRSSQVRDLEANNLFLKRELEQAANNVKDYQRQLESQRESMILRKGEDLSTKDVLYKKNKEMSEYLSEIKKLQDENDQLQVKIEASKDELIDATKDMNKLTDDYHSLKIVLEDTESIMENMRDERDVLRSQIQDLRQILQGKQAEDNSILASLEQKASEWKSLFNEKENEIVERDKIIADQQKKIRLMESDTEKSDLAKLQKDVTEKQQEIELLKEKLEMATSEITEVTAQIEKLKSGPSEGLPSLRQQQQLKKANDLLRQEKTLFSKEQERVIEAEKELMRKDQIINEISTRMNQYEKGQYGLLDAVQEIKDLKNQLSIRDRDIEACTKSINHLQLENDALISENETFRERLGLEPRENFTVEELQEQKNVRQEQMLTLNRVLSKEIESLEEERLQLKQILRKQAMERGARAVELGLTSADLKVVEDIANESYRPGSVIHSKHRHQAALKPESEKANELKMQLDDVRYSKIKLEEQNKDLKDEVNQLEIGLKELIHVFRSYMGQDSLPASGEMANLDQLIAILDSKKNNKDEELSSLLKAQINQLQGRNLQLHDELDTLRKESNERIIEKSRHDEEVSKMQKEIESLREIGAGVIRLNPLKLPEGMLPSSTDIISSLNEYLVQILQELHNKELLVTTLQTNMENCYKKISVISHQQALLYKEYIDAKSEFESKMAAMKIEVDEAQLSNEQHVIRVQQYEKSFDEIKQGGDDIQKELVNYARKVTVLLVNERSLTRRYTMLQEVESSIRRENGKLHTDMTQMEAAIAERIGYLERQKEMSSFKIAALQKRLDECVPNEDLEKANREYNGLTTKYRDLLQSEANLTQQSVSLDNLQLELQQAKSVNEQLKRELQLEKERSYTLQQMIPQEGAILGGGGIAQGTNTDSLSRKLATLEMLILNETQKANHATHKYDQLKMLVNQLETRNAELEARFKEMAKNSVDSQRIEMELREQLQNAVPVEISNADKQYITKLESKEADLQDECDKLKEVAQVASDQCESISRRQISQEKELASLRHQLHDLQMETDEKTIIAKLHQQLIALNVSESVAVQKLEAANRKFIKSQSLAMKWERKCDEKDHALYRTRMENSVKTRFLKKTIQDMRRQYSGCLPLLKQERYSRSMQSLREKNIYLEQKLEAVSQQSREIESSLANLALQKQHMEELIQTLKDRKGAEKVVEWHKKVSEIRCDNASLKRQLAYKQETISHFQQLLRQSELHLEQVEKESENATKELDDRQLLWEQHEVELERRIYEIEKQQKDLLSAAQKFEEATGSIPDQSLPVANQLQLATETIKNHILTIIKTRAEAKKLSKDLTDSDLKIKELNQSLVAKEKVIGELRLHLPPSKYNILLESRKIDIEREARDEKETTLHATAVRAAETTIESLKMMLNKKDDTIAKYETMLNDIRKETNTQVEAHKKEIKLLQDRVKVEVAEQLRKVKQMHLDYVNEPQPLTLGSKQLAKLHELEDVVKEQDLAMSNLSTKLAEAKKETQKMKRAAEVAIKQKDKEIASAAESHKESIEAYETNLHHARKLTAEFQEEVTALNEALDAAKIANETAPSRTMKNLVERLRNQLSIKDKQQKSLSQALLQLRADMVNVTQENVEINALKSEEMTSVQALIDKKTGLLKKDIAALEAKLASTRHELQADRDSFKAEIALKQKGIQEKEAAVFHLGEKLREHEQIKSVMDRLRAENKKLKDSQREGPVRLEQQEKQARPMSAGQRQGEKVQGEVIKWEESKKWQKKVETLRERLKEKTTQCQKLEKSNEMMKDIIGRLEKDKLAMQSRSKGNRSNEDSAPLRLATYNEDLVPVLKGRIFELENENNDLLRKSKFGANNEAFVDLKIQNEELEENLRLIAESNFSDDPEALISLENTFRKQSVDTKRENLELQFELEQTQIELPRLRERVKDLDEYVEVLKSEVSQQKTKGRGKAASASGMGGQSVEDLERVIAAMRRVIERLQGESETFKKQAAKRTSTQSEVAKENRELKQELQRMRTSLANAGQDGSGETDQTTAKQLAQENQRLRKDLKKSQEERVKDNKTRDVLMKENVKLKNQLSTVQGRSSNDDIATENDRDLVATLQLENEELKSRVQSLLSKDRSASVQGDIGKKLQEYDRLVTNELQLRTAAKTLELELKKVLSENQKLKKELEAFDPAFFEEIEDLKYNYKKSVELNIIYERQLIQLSRQFGVDVRLQNDK